MNTARRWWTYQHERFPLLAHGPLILAFSLCAVCFSALLRDSTAFPPWPVITVAFLSSLIAFLHLRIADEFKDFADDAKFRPYRAVPRGLVTLRGLGLLGLTTALIQLALALLLDPRLLLPLLVTWTYLALMSREFFIGPWLKAHPFTYLWSHMIILPLIDFYATACDWLVADGRPPSGLFWFVIVSFFNGCVIELGRKIRAPADEKTGVDTYSALWGRAAAVRAWLAALALTIGSALFAASLIDFLLPVAVALGFLILLAAAFSLAFLKNPTPGRGKRFELLAGLWTLTLYLSLGLLPMITAIWK